EPGYWVARGWSREGRVATSSAIDVAVIDRAHLGTIHAGGIAFAGVRGVSKVEVRVDEGEWQDAELRTALSSTTWVVWRAELRDNLYMLKGGGGNTAVFIRTDGITVVDTKNPGWGQPILEKIKELSNKPVTQVVNTHTHGDHVSGNVDMPMNVEVIVQENTKA